MRVALDATPLTLSSGGLARYARELSVALAKTYRQDDFLLISDQPFAMPAPSLPNLRAGGGPRNRLERKWWLWGLDREMDRQGCDLFHGTNFAVPYLARRPSVLTLLDLSPWMSPGWHHAADRVRARTPPLIGLGIATMIVTPSQAVRRQAMERFGISAARIVAVPLAASAQFHPVAAPCAAPYFLYVGTLEPRKNISQLVAAWRAVRHEHPVDLVLAGRRRTDAEELAVEPGLRILGEVSDAELPALYSGALAFVYPSAYEGFGLPVLEAMQCGACVITSRDPAIREVAGDAAVFCDGETGKRGEGETGGWVDALCAAATRPEWVGQWREKALRRAREFSWERTARMTREVYEEARRRFLH